MIFWCFSAIALGAAAVAVFAPDLRISVLALWAAGLGVGALHLSMGAELLAVVQWILSTLLALAFIFQSITFGEFGVKDEQPPARRLISAIVPCVLGAVFAAVIWLGTKHLPGAGFDTDIVLFSPAAEGVRVEGQNTALLGRTLVQDHLLSLEMLALTLFLVVVGAGVIARSERVEK